MSYKRIAPQPVIEGGTGISSATAYAVLNGGTTSTSALQSAASVGTSGQQYTSNGAGLLPTFQAAAGGIAGPVSSTDNALARWNGTGGDTLQDSSVIVNDNGQMTNASQPAFLGYISTDVANLTGDATDVVMGDSDISLGLTEVFDQSDDFTPSASGGATFEAPVSGKYNIGANWGYGGLTSGTTEVYITIAASNRTFQLLVVDVSVIRDNSNNYIPSKEIMVDMDIADTVQTHTAVSNGTKVVDILGVLSSNNSTIMRGYLIC